MKNSLFYLKKVEELYQIISSKREGLSSEEAKQRLAQFGKNVIPKANKESVRAHYFHHVGGSGSFFFGWRSSRRHRHSVYYFM